MSPTLERNDGTAGSSRVAAGGSSFLVGMILFALGILGLIFADVLATASIVIFGLLLIAGGIAELVHARR